MKNVINRLEKQDRSRYGDSLDPLLQAVRATLEVDGHIYHGKDLAMRLLEKVLTSEAEAAWDQVLASGFVVDVSDFVGVPGQFAWRRHFEGEYFFAQKVIELAVTGGKGSLIFGNPGTGKTETLAQMIVTAEQTKQRVCVGSATHNSALVLEERLTSWGGATVCQTVHSSHGIPVDVEKFSTSKTVRADVCVIDELGQLAADTMGMVARRWPKNADVILSLGPGQLLPVGPGAVGEDLLDCLKSKSLPGWELFPKTVNHRSKDALSMGIPAFYESVASGKVEVSGPGFELIPFESWKETRDAAALLTVLERSDFSNEEEPVACFVPLDLSGAEIIGAKSTRILTNKQGNEDSVEIGYLEVGERVRIKECCGNAYKAKIRKGEIVKVIDCATPTNDLAHSVTVETQGGVQFSTTRENLRRKLCITGHAAQGMEIDSGTVVALNSRITDRRWLFTAVSRCKKTCKLLYQEGTLETIVGRVTRRRTLFPLFFDLFCRKHLL